MTRDNIAAIATAAGAAGVAVIRLSGDSPLKIAEKMFRPAGRTPVAEFEPYRMYPGEIAAEDFSDFGLCVYFRAPRSFTGEDVVEFHTHGGQKIAQGVLNKAVSLGARPAGPGEFTRRAFINGKLSLASAEGLIDMINSRSSAEVRAGYSLYRERLTGLVSAMQDGLSAALAQIDADMDFPEEGLEETSRAAVKETLAVTLKEVRALLGTFKAGSRVKNGVKVGIVGKPNTGKSSLLNALLQYDKAIVSDCPGTTRDVVEGSLEIRGVRFYISDTAGIRDSADRIESMGVELSKRVLKESDVLLFVIDGADVTEEDKAVQKLISGMNVITVVNKTDKGGVNFAGADLYVSALTGENVECVKEALFARTVGAGTDTSGDFLCEERHYAALLRAEKSLNAALETVRSFPLDIAETDIREAWSALGEITGRTASEEIIEQIFSRFCVGK